ncbi:manganese-dependent inorganic pyrophosphatase [Deinococcus peraridilitoris]|uniref:inorganic diphosphatase n=1 Tax=Deinococcus peraridilitoris (strain DSM 19664 / LMG 22246 / CIP 109416 / KR-200) TaxID=937777 RepID=L0A0J2_DEIPD|nr:manganese-dependent inorganic pyrophosphatase [Deinococcus peraridilitoris]AFZ66677.1 inorganic pyrophosphatase/exopolyphosphatase [Deinococcus peraridilitoris DSM 19664]
MTAVFGHLNPDTDAITAALVYASFLRRTGREAQAYRLGEPNRETEFVLRTAGVDLPPLLDSLPEDSAVALVDHNESSQSLPSLATLNVTHVVDHHKLGDLATNVPVYLRFEPLGSTGTILAKLHREANLPIEQTDARLLLSAILSDTLHFRSPTTTPEDREVATYLAQIAGIADVSAYAGGMFAAKSDLGDIAAEKLLKMDYKVFEFAGRPYGLGVVETTNPGYVFGRKAELLSAMDQEKAKSHLAGVVLSVVDILNETNRTLVLSATEELMLREAFGANIEDGVADLGSRISRKKQIVPVLEAYFEGQ